jgi:hypothetical protein
MSTGLKYKSEAATRQWFLTTNTIVEGLLKKDLKLVDGSVLRIDAFEFQTVRPEFRWTGHAEDSAAAPFYSGSGAFGPRVSDGHEREEHNGSILRLHRRAPEKTEDSKFPEVETRPFEDVDVEGEVLRDIQLIESGTK